MRPDPPPDLDTDPGQKSGADTIRHGSTTSSTLNTAQINGQGKMTHQIVGENTVSASTSGSTSTTIRQKFHSGDANTVSGESAQRVDRALGLLEHPRLTNDSAVHFTSLESVKLIGKFQHTFNSQIAEATVRNLSSELHARSSSLIFDMIDMQRRALSLRFSSLYSKEHIISSTWFKPIGETDRGGFIGNDFSVSGWTIGSGISVGNHAVIGFALSETRISDHRAADSGRMHDRQSQGQFYWRRFAAMAMQWLMSVWVILIVI